MDGSGRSSRNGSPLLGTVLATVASGSLLLFTFGVNPSLGPGSGSLLDPARPGGSGPAVSVPGEASEASGAQSAAVGAGSAGASGGTGATTTGGGLLDALLGPDTSDSTPGAGPVAAPEGATGILDGSAAIPSTLTASLPQDVGLGSDDVEASLLSALNTNEGRGSANQGPAKDERPSGHPGEGSGRGPSSAEGHGPAAAPGQVKKSNRGPASQGHGRATAPGQVKKSNRGPGSQGHGRATAPGQVKKSNRGPGSQGHPAPAVQRVESPSQGHGGGAARPQSDHEGSGHVPPAHSRPAPSRAPAPSVSHGSKSSSGHSGHGGRGSSHPTPPGQAKTKSSHGKGKGHGK